MKKSKKIISIVLCLLAVLSLSVGCSKSDAEDKVIKVGATQVPGGDLFEYLKDDIEKEGYELKITIFDDYNLPNEALDNGEIDANLFQHEPYLNKAKEEKGYKLSPVVGLYESPLYVYSYKIKSIDDLKAGDKFALPDDPTNGSRALKYLQDELGLIKLKDSVENPGVKDIVENPKKIEFIEANAAQLPSLLSDVTCAFINGNYAVAANLDANKDSIYCPKLDGTYTNILVSRTDDVDSEKIQVLKKVLTSEKSKKFLEEHYKGVIVPVFQTRKPRTKCEVFLLYFIFMKQPSLNIFQC